MDLAPYTRVAQAFRAQILEKAGLEKAGDPGDTGPADPGPATFADGLATRRVLDAVRRSAAEQAWIML
jgi:predicted dehydrogenase